MAGVFRFPHIVSAIARKPEAIWWAERSPSGFSKRAVFSRAQRIRLRTVISFPHGSTRVQILASWFVSKRPAIGDCWAIAVPSARLAVCPAAEMCIRDRPRHGRPQRALHVGGQPGQEPARFCGPVQYGFLYGVQPGYCARQPADEGRGRAETNDFAEMEAALWEADGGWS